MNKLQTNSHDDTFYYHWDLQINLKSENRLTIDTSCTDLCMVPLDYSQIPFYPNDASLFYCPVPPSPMSASVETVISITSPPTGPMLLPSPDDLYDPLMSGSLWSNSDVYDSFTHRSESKPNDQAIKTKRTMGVKGQLKPFVCKICSRPFARKHDLQRHTRVHTGVKPYSCLHCKKAFIRTDALKHHLRVVETCRTSPIIQAMKESGDRRYRNL